MIPIKIEATNPSSIGSYKNTPFEHPIQPRNHDKPEKGSYTNWVAKALNESKCVLTEDSNLTEDELVEAAVSAITQRPEYKYIAYWIDNEVDDGLSLSANNDELRYFIRTELFSKANMEYASGADTSADVNELLRLWKGSLSRLESALEKQYRGGT